MVTWFPGGHSTRLPLGFAALRMETNRLSCHATGGWDQSDALERDTAPVQLLCCALRLAPPYYGRIELAAHEPDQPLEVRGSVSQLCGDAGAPYAATASFSSIAELAVAMRRFAPAERLSLHLTPDEQGIVIRRTGSEMPPGAAVWQ